MPEGTATLLPWNSCPVEHTRGILGLGLSALRCQQMELEERWGGRQCVRGQSEL